MTFSKTQCLATLVLFILMWAGCNNSSTNEDTENTTPTEEQAVDQQAEQEQAPPLSPEELPAATDVTDNELDNVSGAIKAMQIIEQGSQQKMIEAIMESGMDIQRFSEIMQQKQNPDTELGLSAEEEELYSKAEAQLQATQLEIQNAFEGAIQENDLTVERYQSIMMAVQTDTSLQRKIDERMNQ